MLVTISKMQEKYMSERGSYADNEALGFPIKGEYYVYRLFVIHLHPIWRELFLIIMATVLTEKQVMMYGQSIKMNNLSMLKMRVNNIST
ncbi:MAG: hypothetical protein HC887_00960 [Desulfobacteraceae bacterium]|nr:hypothetical protein [Desulfobacteraceae bacterium]